MNGWQLAADQNMYADFVLDVAAGRREKKNVLEFFRDHSTRLSD